MEQRLFAVYLGGRAPRCNTELHDVVFVVGTSIGATYEQLVDKWFGDPLTVHLDSWIVLEQVDGYRLTLGNVPPSGAERLYFVNLGAYQPGVFTELHANAFLVADEEPKARRRAKQALLRGADSVHTDDLFDVDDCLRVDQVDGHFIHLEPTDRPCPLVPHNGYHVIPKAVVQRYAAKRDLPMR